MSDPEFELTDELASFIGDLHDSEINGEISWFYDGVWGVKIGDHLMVIGAPSRDPASHDVTLVREVQRPRDGWSWRSNAPFVQPSR